MKIAVIGFGAFGYALGLLIARAHPKIKLVGYDIDESYVKGLEKDRHHPQFHSKYTAPKNLSATSDVAECLEKADVVIMAVPAQLMRKVAEGLKDNIAEKAIIMNVSKALENNTNKRMSQVIREALGKNNPIATLSGGMIASDVASGHPVGAEIGCEDEKALKVLQDLFKPTKVHIDITTDIVGVEFSGSFKNVISIGAGIVDGLGLGISTKAFYVAQILREIEDLSVKLGAKHHTFHTSSNAWMGDLMTSAYGNSRNRYFGELIGKGMSMKDAVDTLAKDKKHSEGLATLHVVFDLVDEYEMKAPFLRMLYSVVYNGADAMENFQNISLYQNA